MKRQKTILAACAIGLALMVTAAPSWAQATDLCTMSGRGSLTNGDEFFFQVTLRAGGVIAPGSIWRHSEINLANIRELVFVGRVDLGTCLVNGSTIGVFRGIGRLRGRPVAFEAFVRDNGPGTPDFYDIEITDSDGIVVLQSVGDTVSGDIVAF